MDLPIKTASGGKVSVHFGKIVTTNLWGSWVVVDDLGLKARLQTACKTLTTDVQWIDFKTANDPIGKVHTYSRTSPGAPGAPASSPSTSPSTSSSSAPFPAKLATDPTPKPDPNDRARVGAAEKLVAFFSEFTFNPAARFLNTLSKLTSSAAKQFVTGYAKLCNYPDAKDIAEKVKSREFDMLATELYSLRSDRVINDRVRLYYGDPGTGKTTRAIKENPNAKVFICNSSLSGDDLLQVFDFNDETGHPVFKKSVIREAMENGEPIILDEINLLNMDALRTLQEITDDKSVVNFRGDNIAIKPGFKIIGTMNLMIGGQAYGLPEALVDRAEYIEEFALTPDLLAKYGF